MFKVQEIINSGEIIVSPNWVWERKTGNKVRVLGFHPPIDEKDEGFEFAKKKMTFLLNEKQIELFKPTFIDKYGEEVLFCHIYLSGVDIKNYFSEFENGFK